MAALAERTDFTLRDPGALGALLVYDWRLRKLLTDDEVITEAVDRPVSTGVLRHLQRLGFIKAVHGVRPHGGRMRLWPIEEVLKLQIVLDLRHTTGARLSACVDALNLDPQVIEEALDDWERHVGGKADDRSTVKPSADGRHPLTDSAFIAGLSNASVQAFICRSGFDTVSEPAFLL